jgi:hypothetical protein
VDLPVQDLAGGLRKCGLISVPPHDGSYNQAQYLGGCACSRYPTGLLVLDINDWFLTPGRSVANACMLSTPHT